MNRTASAALVTALMVMPYRPLPLNHFILRQWALRCG